MDEVAEESLTLALCSVKMEKKLSQPRSIGTATWEQHPPPIGQRRIPLSVLFDGLMNAY